MAGPDSTAQAQLAASVVLPRFLAFLDVVGDPVLATTWPTSLDFTAGGTGDSDLDGKVFSAVDPSFVTIGAVRDQEGGSETLKCSLSGIVGPDSDLLNVLGDPANWQGRVARLWQGVCDADGVPKGGIWNYYTGRMVALRIRGSASSQIVEVDIENYLAAIAPASNRTYLDQRYFDPDDASAEAAIAVANGVPGSPGTNMSGQVVTGSSGNRLIDDFSRLV